MIKKLLILVLCCCPILLYAQEEQRPFIQNVKAWIVVDKPSKPNYLRSYYLYGDTVIDSRSCVKIMEWILDRLSVRSSYYGSIYEEDGKVWLFPPRATTPDLLYDFKAEPGEKVVFDEGVWVEDWGYVGRKVYVIDRVDYLTVNGQRYRRQYVKNENGEQADIWIEGVGGPNLFCKGWPDENYVLSCLVDGNEVFSKDDFTRTEKEAAPYNRMLAVGKKWNLSYTDRVNPDNSYFFDYEIKSDTIIGGVRHFRLFSHNLDIKGDDKELGLLFEGNKRVYSIWTGLSNPDKLLYDFGIHAGEKVNYHIINNVRSIECDEIRHDGNTLRRFWMGYEPYLSSSAWNPIHHALDWWVEGIGSSTDFIRPYLWTPARDFRLESCTLNGDTLFTYADFDIPEMAVPDMPEAPYHSMLAEGKSWLYHYTCGHSDPETGEISRTEYDVTYTLRGDTVIGGREYRKMYEEHEGKCGYHSAWREDGRKIYAAYPNGRDSLCYDFGLPYLGQAPYTYQNGLYRAAYLATKDVIQAGGQYHTRCWFINDRFDEMSLGCWVDGFGSNNGLIYPHHETNYYLPYWHFVSCTMPDGTVITAKDLQGKAVEYDGGILELDATSLHLDNNRIYDLSGRVIEHPIPRHIYIKNGRKYVK